MNDVSAMNWTSEQCVDWAKRKHLNTVVLACIAKEDLDGKCLLTLTEGDIRDMRDKYSYAFKISDIKRFWIAVRCLQRDNHTNLEYMGLVSSVAAISDRGTNDSLSSASSYGTMVAQQQQQQHHIMSSTAPIYQHQHSCGELVHHMNHHDIERVSPPLSVDGRATSIQPEFFKTTISLGKSTVFILSSRVKLTQTSYDGTF